MWLQLRGREYTSLPFHEPLLYSRVRHPLYIGWAIAFWATPTMTIGHLLFASVLTLYMVVAAVIEVLLGPRDGRLVYHDSEFITYPEGIRNP